MKISIICTEYPPNYRGGLGIYMQRVIKQLRQVPGLNLHLYTLNYPHDLPKVEEDGPLTVERISPCSFTKKGLKATQGELSIRAIAYNALNLAMFNWHTFRKLWRAHRKKEVGVLAVHDWMSVPSALLLHWLTRQEIVFHVHSTEMSMNLHGTNGLTPKVADWLEKRIAKAARKIIVPSEEIQDQLVSEGWEPQKFEIVHHGYEDSQLQRVYEEMGNENQLGQLRDSLNLKPDTKVLVFAGRLITHKGVNKLIDAMPAVVEKHPNIKLVLVGSGEAAYQSDLQATIESYGLSEHVHAYYEQMPQEQVIQHYCLADVCIFPSQYEPFGFVALEAMSLEKPVVLGHGFPKVIRAPDTIGLIEDPVSLYTQSTQTQELSDQIITLLQEPSLRDALGKRAKQYVQEKFKWQKTGEQTLAVYQAVGS